MTRVKPVRRPLLREVIYTEGHFKMLRAMRQEAMKVMSSLEARGVVSFLHGSAARGDVNSRSDIDIVAMDVIPSYKVELALSDIGYEPLARFVTMATPSHALKATIQLRNNIVVTFPLVKLKTLEHEFYKFGGICSLSDVMGQRRTRGVDKRLLIRERERVLLRRDASGRTGVYLKKQVPPDESIEGWAERIIRQNPPAISKLRNR